MVESPYPTMPLRIGHHGTVIRNVTYVLHLFSELVVNKYT